VAFQVLIYEKEDKTNSDENIKHYKQFYADSYQTALRKFGEICIFDVMNRTEYKDRDFMEFGLLGNKKFLLSTSIYNKYYEKEYAKDGKEDKDYKFEYAGKEHNESVAQKMIGWSLQSNKIAWPEKTVNVKSPDHYSLATYNTTTEKYHVTDCKTNQTLCNEKFKNATTSELEDVTFAMVSYGNTI